MLLLSENLNSITPIEQKRSNVFINNTQQALFIIKIINFILSPMNINFIHLLSIVVKQLFRIRDSQYLRLVDGTLIIV